jgi:hypothetical protein
LTISFLIWAFSGRLSNVTFFYREIYWFYKMMVDNLNCKYYYYSVSRITDAFINVKTVTFFITFKRSV